MLCYTLHLYINQYIYLYIQKCTVFLTCIFHLQLSTHFINFSYLFFLYKFCCFDKKDLTLAMKIAKTFDYTKNNL